MQAVKQCKEQDYPTQRQADALGRELTEKRPDPATYSLKAKAAASSEPGTEYWLP